MTSDRQLLERAAKAVGMTIGKNRGEWMWWEFMDCFNRQDATSGASYMWNPLKSDADALRLAVKRRMEIDMNDERHSTIVYAEVPTTGAFKVEEPHGSDPYAATRRCIVRAAASLGEHK